MLCRGLSRNVGEFRAMRLTIEIIAATVLLFCLTATGAAFAIATKTARSADALSWPFGVVKDVTPRHAAPHPTTDV
jgi:hypothetical protein